MNKTKVSIRIIFWLVLLSLSKLSFAQQDRNLTMLDSLSRVSQKEYKRGDYSESIRIEQQMLENYAKVQGTENIFYATHLNNIAVCQSKLGYYSEAIRLGQQALDILNKINKTDNIRYSRILSDLAHCHSKLNNYPEAVRLKQQSLEIESKVKNTDNRDYAVSLHELAGYQSALGRYSEVVRLEQQALEIIKRVSGTDNDDYVKSLNNLAECQHKLGNHSETVRLFQQIIDIKGKLPDTENEDYAKMIAGFAVYQAELGNNSDAARLGQQAIDVWKKTLSTEHRTYVKMLSNLANFYYKLNNYTEAIRLKQQALEIEGGLNGTDNSQFAASLNILAGYHFRNMNYSEAANLEQLALEILCKRNETQDKKYALYQSFLASCQSKMDNYSEAIRLEKESLKILERVSGKENTDYAFSLYNYAFYQAKTKNYNEAISSGLLALKILDKVTGAETLDYALSLSNLAGYYGELGNYTEAVRLEKQSLEIRGKVSGVNNIDYVEVLNNLASYNAKSLNYSEAIRLKKESLNILEKLSGIETADYAESLSNLAEFYYEQGNYSEAIRLEQRVLEIRGKVFGIEHIDYARSLNNLAGFQSKLGNYSEGIRLVQESLRILKNNSKTNTYDYAVSLNNLAMFSIESFANYTEAINLLNQAFEIYDSLGVEHDITMLNNLALCHARSGNWGEAIRIGQQAIEAEGRVLGTHPRYIMLFRNLAFYHYGMSNDLAASRYAYKSTELTNNTILKNFADLTVNERRMFWDMYSSWYTVDLNAITYTFPTDSLCSVAYNGALLSKGLILNSEIEFSKLLHDSGDQYVDSLYKELRSNRLQLQRLYEKPIKERMISTDSLERVAYNQEQELIKRSKVYGDYTHNLRIQWEDVQNKLSDRSVAIEFLSFPKDSVTTRYMALVLKKGMKFPQMVRLFEESHLRSIREPYSSSEVATLVWKPLAEYINDADTIYFGASGDIYKTAIEYVPHWSEGFRMSDKWNIFRLSSTRELALVKDSVGEKKAAVYGGITYNAGTDLLEEDKKMYGGVRDMSMALYSTADLLGFRGGVSELPATKKEVINIDKALKSQHIPTTLKMNTQATEGAFKSLSGKQTSMLHIATHGFYWTETEAKYVDHLSFLKQSNNHPKYEEDKAMTRSGLLFAGANNALRNENLPEGVNDGILTASEISQLDFRGMDLVVLSACQTGLGEIGSDGVFGLQRGFKKAGANTLLMSLWKVDDDATQLLMTEFYRNLTSGKMSKYESLKQAQKYVREYEVKVPKDESSPQKGYDTLRRYENPIYWAAFILLDAVE